MSENFQTFTKKDSLRFLFSTMSFEFTTINLLLFSEKKQDLS